MNGAIEVLHVDDEPPLLDQGKIFLEKEEERLDLTTAQSPKKALELLEKEDFDVIVSDYQMPDIDGLEFLQEVREERESDIPFIIFTGKGREEVAMKALNLGADRYIKKEGNPKDQFEFLAHAIVRENNQYDLYEEKEKREKKIKELYEASIELSTYDSEEEIYHQVLDSFESILDFEASSICMAGDECLVVQATDAKNVEEGEERANDVGIRGLTYQNQKSYLIDDLSDWDEGQPSDPDFKSVLSISIENEGVFQALSYEKEYFDEFDLEMSELLVTHMWEVIKGIRYQDELEMNETWLSQIIENSSIPTFVIDEKHKVTHWNKACENLTDVSKEAVIGTQDAWKGFYDEERPVMADLVLKDASKEEIREYYGDKFSESDLLEEAHEAVDFFPEFGDEGRWVYFTAAPIKDSKGDRVGAIETLQDISERKEKEEALKENEEKYRAIFESANDAIFVMKDGKFINCNKKTLEIFECSKDEMIGESPFEFSPEEQPDGRRSKEKAREKINSALEGEPQSFEWVHTTKDGEPFHTQVTLNRYEIDGEKFVIAVVRDISEQKEAEKALQQAKQNYEELFAKSADALYVLDPDTAEILDINQRVSEMYGYSREEALELTVEDLSSGEQPYTQEEARKRVQKAKEEGPITFEWRGQKKDGTLIWEEVTLKQAEIGGESRVLASVRDISERKKEQEALKRKEKYIDHTPGFMTVLDEQGNIKYHSPSNEIKGLDSDKFIGSEAFEFVHPVDREDTLEMFSKVLEDPGKEYRMELRGEVEDGWIWLDVRAVNYLDVPEIEGIIITAQDITEKKESKERIEENKEKIKKLHDIASEFEESETEKEICKLVIQASERILEFEVCGIDFVEDDEFVPIALSSEIEDGFIRRKVEEAGISKKVYQEKESLLVEDSRQVDFSKPVVSDCRSSITIPMSDFGIYQALSTEVGKFNEQDLELAEILVNHATEAINRLRSEEKLKKKKEKVEKLHQASADLESCQSEREIYRYAVKAAEDILDFDMCLFSAVEQNRIIVKETSSGIPEGGYEERYLEDGGIDKQTYLNQKSYLIDDLAEEEDSEPVKSEYRSAISVPIGEFGLFQAVS
ncbi:MAG: PAS domain S-box protein, partial [Candidatus Thermoplasmatota archaeon]